MTAFFVFAFFALGAIVASFVGVVAERLNTGTSIARGRSRCDSCGELLGFPDLVPVLSYLALAGRCRRCRSRVSPLSTLTELALGALFALAYAREGLSLALVLLLAALSALAAIVLYDLRHTVIPPSFLGVFLAASALYALLASPNLRALAATAGTALAVALFLAAFHYLSRGRAMGLSDAPLALALALLAGPLALSGLLYSFWIGAAIGIIVLARAPAGHRMGIEVPFAPYLAAGFLLALFTQWNLFSLLSGVGP